MSIASNSEVGIHAQLKALQLNEWSLPSTIHSLRNNAFNEIWNIDKRLKEEYEQRCQYFLPSYNLEALASELVSDLVARLESQVEALRVRYADKEWYNSLREPAYEWQSLSSSDLRDPNLLYDSKAVSKLITAIYQAVDFGNSGEFERLMSFIPVKHWGFSPGEYRGATPLHWAVLNGRANIVSFMRKKIESEAEMRGAEREAIVNARDEYGFTPLHLVAFPSLWDQTKENFAHVIEDLFSMGSDINPASNVRDDGDYVRIWTYKANHSIALEHRSTVDKGAPCVDNFLHNNAVLPVHLAMWLNRPLLKELLRNWPQTAWEVTSSGDTLLHLAAWGPQFEDDVMKKRLLDDYGVSQKIGNSLNSEGQTPLHIAAFNGNVQVVKALLSCQNIIVNISNGKGFTPVQLAYAMLKACRRRDPEELRRDTSYFEKFGFSNFAGKFLDKQYSDPLRVILLLDVGSMKTLQLIEWDLECRIAVMEWIGMLSRTSKDELDVTILRKLREAGNMSDDVSNSVESSKIKLKTLKKNRQQRTDIKWVTVLRGITPEYGLDVTKLIQNIYGAIEEGDFEEFRSWMNMIPMEHWAFSPEEYGGATPLHWAVLHGQHQMVSFMQTQLDEFHFANVTETQRNRLRSDIVNARDNFGFTPLHMVVFPSLWKLSSMWKLSSVWKLSPMEYICVDGKADNVNAALRRALVEDLPGLRALVEDHGWAKTGENCAQMIEDLHLMGADISSSLYANQGVYIWTDLPTGVYKSKQNSKYLNSSEHPLHLAVWFSHPSSLEKLLKWWPAITFETTSAGDTILHNATAWDAMIRCRVDWGEIETVLKKHLDSPSYSKAVNFRNYHRQTPLHKAVFNKSLEWVEVLLGCEHVNVDSRDRDGYTPRELANYMLQASSHTEDNHDILKELLANFKKRISWRKGADNGKGKSEDEGKDLVQIINFIDYANPAGLYRETEALQRERQVYVDAANAILVGAALIASASFGAWLQPPLGYNQYYSNDFLIKDPAAPPDTYEAFVAIKQHWIIHMFWIFNSLAFFFSLATVIAGADAALPQQGLKDLKQAVSSVRKAVKWASWLLSVAIVFVIGTFATVGFAILPHIEKYRINMYCTLLVGLLVCTFTLVRLLRKLSPNAESTVPKTADDSVGVNSRNTTPSSGPVGARLRGQRYLSMRTRMRQELAKAHQADGWSHIGLQA